MRSTSFLLLLILVVWVASIHVEGKALPIGVRFCTPHQNGFFALGCSPRYLVCVDGRPTYNACERGVFARGR
uniref:Chitin-binding type-2 domain-containing protein n=1 Tax=Parascaris univalens TaxID=6257 RepID=A0A915C7T3_PARUN